MHNPEKTVNCVIVRSRPQLNTEKPKVSKYEVLNTRWCFMHFVPYESRSSPDNLLGYIDRDGFFQYVQILLAL